MKKVKINKKETREQTDASSSGSYSAPAFQQPIKRKLKPEEIEEVTDASSSGSYDVPLFGNRKDPLKIDGEKSIKNSRAVKDKNFPKWGGPEGIYVKVKEKCKKYPYCNQGIGALEFFEIDKLNESIKQVSKEKGISVSEIKKIVLKEINKIFI